jgi:hypothetical protein
VPNWITEVIPDKNLTNNPFSKMAIKTFRVWQASPETLNLGIKYKLEKKESFVEIAYPSSPKLFLWEQDKMK